MEIWNLNPYLAAYACLSCTVLFLMIKTLYQASISTNIACLRTIYLCISWLFTTVAINASHKIETLKFIDSLIIHLNNPNILMLGNLPLTIALFTFVFLNPLQNRFKLLDTTIKTGSALAFVGLVTVALNPFYTPMISGNLRTNLFLQAITNEQFVALFYTTTNSITSLFVMLTIFSKANNTPRLQPRHLCLVLHITSVFLISGASHLLLTIITITLQSILFFYCTSPLRLLSANLSKHLAETDLIIEPLPNTSITNDLGPFHKLFKTGLHQSINQHNYKTVMIINKEPLNQEILKKLLQTSPAIIYTCTSIDEALQATIVEQIDIIVIDYEQTGIPKIKHLLDKTVNNESSSNSTSITLLIRECSEIDGQLFYDLGITNIFTKPIEPKTFADEFEFRCQLSA